MYIEFVPRTALKPYDTILSRGWDACVIKFCDLRRARNTTYSRGVLEPTYYFSSRYRPLILNFKKSMRTK
jgi:hypothetical protein